MPWFSRFAVVALLLSVAWPAVAAGTIGFVDAERAVLEVDQGRARVAELEAWAAPRREEIRVLQQQAVELRQRIASQQRVASEETLRTLDEELRVATREFEDERRAFQRELDRKQNEFLADVAVKIGQVATDYAREHGYEAVFVLTAQPLVYVSEDADLTDTVIRLYNERFPVEGIGGQD